MVDGYSRYLLVCEAHGGTSYEAARGSLERLFRERGLPRRVRSDNGSPFASIGAGRLSRLNVWWLKLGIEVERIEPGKPQQAGFWGQFPNSTARVRIAAVERWRDKRAWRRLASRTT